MPNRVRSTRKRSSGHRKSVVKKSTAVDPSIEKAALEQSEQLAPPIQSPAPTPIMLRPFTNEDQAFVMQLTKEEMGPIFRENYGYELNLENVMYYVHSAQTRIIIVNDQTAGYVSHVVDDSGKMNIGSLILTGDHKRKGYGTRILRQLEQEARGMGLVEMEGFVQSSNQNSLNFLKKQGFREMPSMQPQTVIMIKDLRTTN